MMRKEYSEEDFLLLSGIQHFDFCRRQWALIHVEKQWAENGYTASGRLIHGKAHDPFVREKRSDIIISRAMPIKSFSLGVSGECDVVEFKRSQEGTALKGVEGSWSPCPIEYKRGEPKASDCDRLQLTAQVICLEEMFLCDICEAYLFYDKPHRREKVVITAELRDRVYEITAQMHKYMTEGYTPRAKYSKKCDACSMKDLCVPKLFSRPKVSDYISTFIETKGLEG